MTTPVDTRIHSVISREILDSRGNPTLETAVYLMSGYMGVASVPSGASVSKYEAVELRDHDPARFHGQGVLTAVAAIHQVVYPKIRGMDAAKQRDLDQALITLDGTPNKSQLGGNTVLSVSLAAAAAAASAYRMPLYQYLNRLVQEYVRVNIGRMPTPLFNVVNGKKHGSPTLDFQEFFVIPASNYHFHDSLRIGVEIYHELKKQLDNAGVAYGIGDEGGFTPAGYGNADAVRIIREAMAAAKYRFATDVFMGIDAASSVLRTGQGYGIHVSVPSLPPQLMTLSTEKLVDLYRKMHETNPLLVLEDPFHEDDWTGWKDIAERMGKETYIVADDLVATNPTRLETAIRERACNAVVLKLNQIGTLSEFLSVVRIAKSYGVKTVVAHRSGETTDTFVADLSVAIGSEYAKFGAPARGERVAKYNRLLAIEEELSRQKR